MQQEAGAPLPSRMLTALRELRASCRHGVVRVPLGEPGTHAWDLCQIQGDLVGRSRCHRQEEQVPHSVVQDPHRVESMGPQTHPGQRELLPTRKRLGPVLPAMLKWGDMAVAS